MLGPGSPAGTFAPARPARGESARFSRSEFGTDGDAWLMADAERSTATTGAEAGAFKRWLARTVAAASKFAGVFL